MPGPISDQYGGMPVCICGHFKYLHDINCQAEGCNCEQFIEQDEDEEEWP